VVNLAKGGVYSARSDVRESVLFALQVPASGKGSLRYAVTAPGTLELLTVRFYIGCNLQLRLRPVLERRGEGVGSGSNLVKFVNGGLEYVDGDDDKHSFKMAYAVREGDFIVVNYQNMDAVNAYNFRVTADIDYLGGEARTLPGVV